jgi:hypothetical protein
MPGALMVRCEIEVRPSRGKLEQGRDRKEQ